MTAPVEPDRLYEAAEVAALLGIKRRSLLRAVPRGGWPAPDRRIGGRPAWLGQTVLAGLAARQRPAAKALASATVSAADLHGALPAWPGGRRGGQTGHRQET